jgi:hypothetical protein
MFATSRTAMVCEMTRRRVYDAVLVGWTDDRDGNDGRRRKRPVTAHPKTVRRLRPW